jgi:hypothetical protein
MKPASPLVMAGLLGAAFMLSAFSGGGRVANSPAVVPYVCEDGRQASAIYEHGGDYLHAKVLLTFDGRTTELEAAPTLYGARYRSEPSAEEPRSLLWSLRGERTVLAEAGDPHDVSGEGRPIARCKRLRTAAVSPTPGEPGHSEDH